MKTAKHISILGCGWLGLPLGNSLAKKGYFIKGSTTSVSKLNDLKENGIDPFQICITDKEIIGDNIDQFFNNEILIINFPPKRREDIEIYHTSQFQLLMDYLKNSKVKKVVFISSTSVYIDNNSEITELESTTPSKPSGKALVRVEKMLNEQSNFETTIIRFSGLIGYDRMPGRFLANKKNVENGNAPINVIHQDDCIELITQIIEKNIWGEVFNASSDKHPTRKEYYTKAANQIGLAPPSFIEEENVKFKLIVSEKIKNRLNYSFIYPDPMELLDENKVTNSEKISLEC